MELKQILALSAVAVSFAAFAAGETSTTVESSNEFGLLKIVTSSRRVILGVPWCACSATADQEIPVTDFVSTIGLDDNDTLNEYTDGHSYRSWVCLGGTWVGVDGVFTDGVKSDQTGTTGEETLLRGHGLMLIRYGNSGPKPVYLHGQVATAAAQDGSTAEGAPDNPAYTFISYPGDKAWNPNVDVTWRGEDTAFSGDQLIGLDSDGVQWILHWVGSDAEFATVKANSGSTAGTFTSKGWYVVKKTTTIKAGRTKTVNTLERYADSVPAGTGFWYAAKNGVRSFSWN